MTFGKNNCSFLQTLVSKIIWFFRDERRRADQLSDKLRQCQKDLDTLPILQAQVEVYQTDFNAERAAREKIAGEKADLLDELQRLKSGAAPRQVISKGINWIRIRLICIFRRLRLQKYLFKLSKDNHKCPKSPQEAFGTLWIKSISNLENGKMFQLF